MASYFLAVSDVCEQVINVDCFSLIFDPDFMAIIVFYGAHTGLVVQISESPKELPLTGLTAFDSTVRINPTPRCYLFMEDESLI